MEVNNKKLSIGNIIILILAIIGGVAIIFGILQATVFDGVSEQKKAEMEAKATLPYGQYSFAEAHFNPYVQDFSVLNNVMNKVVYVIEEDLFAIYTDTEKYEIPSPKYQKRVMKDESSTKTDGLRIYYDGGSIMPSEDTLIGIEYTVSDRNGNSYFKIYTFDDEVWISNYTANEGKEDTLRYVYLLIKNAEDVEFTDTESLKDMNVSGDLGDSDEGIEEIEVPDEVSE